jgi:hypothetical protein
MQPNGDEVISDLDAVRTEDTARMRFRRRRALNFALSAVTVAAVVVGAALITRNTPDSGDKVGSPLGAGASPTTTATTPPATVADTTPVATSPATSAPASAQTSRTTKPPATTTTTSHVPAPPANPPDLHASAPGSVTLHPDGGIYRGEFTVTLKNTGSPYPWGQAFVTTQPGLEVEFTAGDPGFNGCTYITGPEYYGCVGPVVPGLGGVLTKVIHLKANYAPQPGDLALGTFSVKYVAMPETVGADPTPSDNTFTINVTLANP